MTLDDRTLLERFRADGDSEAFRALVHKHLPLVYTAALRQVDNPALAEEVAQMVFVRLAQRAHRLPPSLVLPGWLHADTRLTALQLLRTERRRRAREAEAVAMQMNESSPDEEWGQLRPLLDEALHSLRSNDRDVLLLRFFENRSWREVSTTFGLSEDAARMRVGRALDKLRDVLSARGFSTAASTLSAALATYGAQAAPASLAATITNAAVGGASAGGSTIALLIMAKTKLALLATVLVTGTVGPAWWFHQLHDGLRVENRTLRSELDVLRTAQAEMQQQMQILSANADEAAKQNRELAQLRDSLHRANQELDGLRRAAAPEAQAAANPTSGEGEPAASIALTQEANAFLQRPKKEQGELLGRLRRQMMGQEKDLSGDIEHNRALAKVVRPSLEQLESQPEQFAEFQTSFLRNAIALEDDSKLEQVRQIVEQTYRQAVTDKLDAPSRPADAEEVQAWALRRDRLDRKATHAVEQILTEDERDRFSRAFLGIMGIDLGLNDGGWHRFVTPNGGVVFPSESVTAAP